MSRTLERGWRVASGVFDPGSGCRACRRAAEAQEYCPGQRSGSDPRHGREIRRMGTRGSAQNVADDAGEPAEGPRWFSWKAEDESAEGMGEW